MISDRFINEYPYLKNINYDAVIESVFNKEDGCLEPYESPIHLLSMIYSKLNNKPEISKKLQEIAVNGRPDIVLSNLKVLEIDF